MADAPDNLVMKTITPIQTLPKILAILGCEDHGPCDPTPTAVCPHCGADGRYVYHFLCDDGTTRGAMAGCIQLFPKHPLTDKVKAILDKKREYDKAKWKLPSWDQDVLNACDRLAAKTMTTQEWEQTVRNALAKRDAYLATKYGRRR